MFFLFILVKLIVKVEFNVKIILTGKGGVNY